MQQRLRDMKIYFERGRRFITAAVENEHQVIIRCPSDYTDIGDDEDLNVFIVRHGGAEATKLYLIAQYMEL